MGIKIRRPADIMAVVVFAAISVAVLMGCTMENKNLIQKSRLGTVRVLVDSNIPAGTGFFIDSEHVVTCFHVVAKSEQKAQQINFNIHPDICVRLESGELIDAKCISIPSQQDISPIQYDFAVLKLKSKPQAAVSPMSLYNWKTPPDVGDAIYFSGYPLDTQMMLTHKGMISGIDSNVIGIQAPINKGNSGSALLTANGEVLGIVSNREGSLSQRLWQIQQQIMEAEKGPIKATVTILKTDPIESIKELTKTLDKHISTGIGYARKTEHLRSYLQKHGIAKIR